MWPTSQGQPFQLDPYFTIIDGSTVINHSCPIFTGCFIYSKLLLIVLIKICTKQGYPSTVSGWNILLIRVEVWYYRNFKYSIIRGEYICCPLNNSTCVVTKKSVFESALSGNAHGTEGVPELVAVHPVLAAVQFVVEALGIVVLVIAEAVAQPVGREAEFGHGLSVYCVGHAVTARVALMIILPVIFFVVWYLLRAPTIRRYSGNGQFYFGLVEWLNHWKWMRRTSLRWNETE